MLDILCNFTAVARLIASGLRRLLDGHVLDDLDNLGFALGVVGLVQALIDKVGPTDCIFVFRRDRSICAPSSHCAYIFRRYRINVGVLPCRWGYNGHLVLSRLCLLRGLGVLFRGWNCDDDGGGRACVKRSEFNREAESG